MTPLPTLDLLARLSRARHRPAGAVPHAPAVPNTSADQDVRDIREAREARGFQDAWAPRITRAAADAHGGHRAQDVRLAIPASLTTTLGCDAVGVPARYASRLMHRLPQVGCVFADTTRWWWIVPAGSDIETAWPPLVRYAADARVSAADPSRGPESDIRMVHRPEGPSPYTPPLPLYFMVCQLAGTTPTWTAR